MTAEQQIQELADSLNVDPSSVRWLANYIIRETPEEHMDLLSDPNWIQACAREWNRLSKHMTERALRHREEAAKVVMAHL